MTTISAVNLHDFVSVLCPVQRRLHQWRGTTGLHPILCGRRTKRHLTVKGKDTSVKRKENLTRHDMLRHMKLGEPRVVQMRCSDLLLLMSPGQ